MNMTFHPDGRTVLIANHDAGSSGGRRSGLQTNSLLAGAGNFFEWSREFYRRSRELAPGSRAG
jgi:hypothetical protein